MNKLIDVLTNLKELILVVTPEKTIKEEVWNRRFEQLMKLLNMKQIILQIIKLKENKTQCCLLSSVSSKTGVLPSDIT
jgi:hypothetical protein